MKDEKFCFKKGTGLIALVGIVLVLAVFAMNAATSQQQATGAKAYFNCPDNSVVDLIDSCPDNLTVMGADGLAVTAKGPLGGNHKCCYPPNQWQQKCPAGSTPDYGKFCPARKVVPGVEAIRALTGTRYACCNWYNTVAPTAGAAAPSSPPVDQVAANGYTLSGDANTILLSQPVNFCTSVGLYDYPRETTGTNVGKPRYFVTDHFNRVCASQKNVFQWNGISGKEAKCFTATGICASNANCASESCLRGQTNGKCLNIPVDFQNCVNAGVAQAKDAPSWTGMLCDANSTCAGGVPVNTCAPQSTKKCVCKDGKKYPTYEDRPGECVVNTTYNCMYGEQTVTSTSTPYKYVNSLVQYSKKCIVGTDGKNTGAACKTDAVGNINGNGNVIDKTNCPLAASSCSDKDATWKAQKYNCSGIADYGKCTPDKYRCACYESNWPTLKYDPTCT
jgi:hypothetical protein